MIAFLYVVAAGLTETGAVALVMREPRNERQAQRRLVLPVAGLSAFVNNTSIVATLLTTGWVDPVVAVMLVAALMGITRCCTAARARANVDWQVVVVVGAAFALGAAMEKTGLASTMAEEVLTVAAGFGERGSSRSSQSPRRASSRRRSPTKRS